MPEVSGDRFSYIPTPRRLVRTTQMIHRTIAAPMPTPADLPVVVLRPSPTAIACQMAIRSYREGRTVRWDAEREEIV